MHVARPSALCIHTPTARNSALMHAEVQGLSGCVMEGHSTRRCPISVSVLHTSRVALAAYSPAGHNDIVPKLGQS